MKSLIVVTLAFCCLSWSCSKPSQGKTNSEQRALAMFAVEGDTPLVTLIRKVQGQLVREEDLESYLALGQLWIRQARVTNDPGYYLSAAACAELALKRFPLSARAMALKAMVAANAHQFEEARSLAHAALNLDGDDLLALSTLADADFELGAIDRSTQSVQTMIDRKPNLPSYGRAAHLRWINADVVGAKQLIRLAIDSGRDLQNAEPWAYSLVQASNYFWAEGDLLGAQAGFQQALDVVPGFPPALIGLGRIALAQGNARDAAESLLRAFKQSPLVETAWLLSDAFEMQGQMTEAEQYRHRVRELGQKTDHLTLGLFEATRSENIDEALSLLGDEVQKRPNVYVLDAWSWALYRAGRLNEAQAASDKACAHKTPEPRFYFHAGAIALARGNSEIGMKLINQALAMNPAFDIVGAQEARRLIAQHLENGGAHASH